MIKAIVAIGNQGQVGLNGRLPWHDKEDLKWFREQTMGKVCVVGWNTAQTLPELKDRKIIIDHETTRESQQFEFSLAKFDVFIIGGPKTYARWNHMIDEWLVSRIDYGGRADAFFDYNLLEGKKVTYRQGGAL